MPLFGLGFAPESIKSLAVNTAQLSAGAVQSADGPKSMWASPGGVGKSQTSRLGTLPGVSQTSHVSCLDKMHYYIACEGARKFLVLQAIDEQIEKMPDEYYHLDEHVMWQVCFATMSNS